MPLPQFRSKRSAYWRILSTEPAHPAYRLPKHFTCSNHSSGLMTNRLMTGGTDVAQPAIIVDVRQPSSALAMRAVIPLTPRMTQLMSHEHSRHRPAISSTFCKVAPSQASGFTLICKSSSQLAESLPRKGQQGQIITSLYYGLHNTVVYIQIIMHQSVAQPNDLSPRHAAIY